MRSVLEAFNGRNRRLGHVTLFYERFYQRRCPARSMTVAQTAVTLNLSPGPDLDAPVAVLTPGKQDRSLRDHTR